MSYPVRRPLLVAAVFDSVGSNGDDDDDECTNKQQYDGNRNEHDCCRFSSTEPVNGHDGEDLQHNGVYVDNQGDKSPGDRYQADQGSEDAKRYLEQQCGIALLEECSLAAESFGKSVKNAHSNEEKDRNDNNVGKGNAAHEGSEGRRTDSRSCGAAQAGGRDQAGQKRQDSADDGIGNKLDPDDAPVSLADLRSEGLRGGMSEHPDIFARQLLDSLPKRPGSGLWRRVPIPLLSLLIAAIICTRVRILWRGIGIF